MKTLTHVQKIAISLVIAVLIIFFATYFFIFKDSSMNTSDTHTKVTVVKESGNTRTSTQSGGIMRDGVMIKDIIVGDGAEAIKGSTVSVGYVGTLEDGSVFDSTDAHGQPFGFTLGEGRVIEGWEIGVLGMKVGGERILTIPPEKAYGVAGGHPLAGKTLIFDIKLLAIQNQK